MKCEPKPTILGLATGHILNTLGAYRRIALSAPQMLPSGISCGSALNACKRSSLEAWSINIDVNRDYFLLVSSAYST